MHEETIFALSSGRPPAAIGIIRISGPHAQAAVEGIAGTIPVPRQASLRNLRADDGSVLDEALVLWFPGPHSATGEDCAELHCHGGLAVIDAVLGALRDHPNTRDAQAGEFTRRALENGRINLNEAEGLADLLSAETELQLANARSLASGQFSRQAERWRERLLHLSAAIEAELDFSDEDDVGPAAQDIRDGVTALSQELRQWLAQPRAERLKEGVRVVLAGPPNAGKSSLFNRLLSYDAAIVSAEPGTTRDAIEQSVVLSGIVITLVDTGWSAFGGRRNSRTTWDRDHPQAPGRC